jgi:cytochrome c-type biogenesis protein CcmH/NrfF
MSTLLLMLLIGSAPAAERAEDVLLAPCCYSEPVASHQSEAAVKMRAEIAAMRAKGMADRQIIEHYKGIYGQRILTVPEGAYRWIAFGVPFVATLIGTVLVVMLIRQMRRAHYAAA